MADTLDLDTLCELERAATPSPWHVHLDDDHAINAIGIAAEPDTGEHQDMATWSSSGPELLAATLIQARPYVVSADRRWQENAELIVAMRNVLPELIRLARRGCANDISEASTSA